MDDPTVGAAPAPRDDTSGHGRLVSLLLVATLVLATLGLAPNGGLVWVLLVGTPIALVRSRWLGGLGFGRPERGLGRTFVLAAGLATVIQLVAVTALEPLVERLVGEPIDVSAFAQLEGDVLALAFTLALVWTLVAFGEEIVFRGWLVTELDRVLGTSRAARIANVAFGSAVFGAGHLYQGMSGILNATLLGLLLAWLYLREKRNLWLPILLHGWIDTTGLVLVYFGVYDDLALW